MSWVVRIVEESVLVLGNTLKYLRSKVGDVHSGLSCGTWLFPNVLPDIRNGALNFNVK